MENIFKSKDKSFKLDRYPTTTDRTLRAWSNAEVYTLNSLENNKDKSIGLYNDRFGFWNTTLAQQNLKTIWHYSSQKKAIQANLEANGLTFNAGDFFTMSDRLTEKLDIALVKVPKSADLFGYILEHIRLNSNDNIEVKCCFMTKYFNKSILEKAELYFDKVEQSLAWKKSRILTLSQPKKDIVPHELRSIEYNNNIYKQLPGVFSSSHIDYASQFLIEHLQISETEIDILDLASGNGILAKTAQELNPKAKLTLMDDFNLAVESSKLNVNLVGTQFLCLDALDEIKDSSFDLVISNPPFHFEHENNIEITLRLMKNLQRCLKSNGRFIFVANKHLNYKTHLMDWFLNVRDIAVNDRFIIIECSNSF